MAIPRKACSLLAALIASGCAYVDPYVPLFEPGKVPTMSKKMPNVTKSVEYLDGLARATQGKRNDVTSAHRWLDLLSFGLGTSAAVAPIYKAHRDLTTGLLLGAGAVYTGNSLFLPSDTGSLYNAATNSLSCLEDKAFAVNGAVMSVYPNDGSDSLADAYANATSFTCMPSTALDEIGSAYDAASETAKRVVAADATIADKLEMAGKSVIIALNGELDKRAPSPEAILAAAKAMPLGLGITMQAESKKPAPVGDTRCTDEQRRRANNLKVQLVAQFERAKRDLDAAVDAIDGLDKACTFNIPAIADLSVSQDNIVLKKDVEISIRVSGGRPPYTPSWDEDPQQYGVQMTRGAPDLFVFKGGDIAKDKTLKLQIRDSSAAVRSKTVTVNAKKDAAPADDGGKKPAGQRHG